VLFHLIDRVDRIEPWRSVTARKLTSRAETFWRDEGVGLQMPAPLVLESLCQAGTWLILSSSDLEQRAALLSVDAVDVLGAVRPGDVLQVEGTVVSRSETTAVLSGRVSVDGRPVLEATAVMCALMPAAQLEDDASVRRMHDRLFATTVVTEQAAAA
jgi:3-hydroxyacyl-[acyl-carrier-protein] dehydratase